MDAKPSNPEYSATCARHTGMRATCSNSGYNVGKPGTVAVTVDTVGSGATHPGVGTNRNVTCTSPLGHTGSMHSSSRHLMAPEEDRRVNAAGGKRGCVETVVAGSVPLRRTTVASVQPRPT